MPDIDILKYPRSINFSKNPIPLKLRRTTPSVEVMAPALLIEKNYLTGVFTEVAVLQGHPDSAGDAYFNFGGNSETESMLQSVFTGFDLPSYNQSTVTSYSQSIRRFKIRVDYYDDDGVLQNVATIGPFHVLMGGVQWEEWPTAGFWKTYYGANPMFLTWHPLTKKVTKTQQEFLSYMVQSASITSIKLYAGIRIPPFESVNLISTTSVSRYKTYLFPAGYTQLNLGSIDTGFLTSDYSVYLRDQDDNLITDEHVYVIDRNYQPFERFFIFKNSLGGPDTLRTTGVAATKLTHKNTIVQRAWDYKYKAVDGQRYDTAITEQLSIMVSTGFRTFAEADYYRELLLSSAVVEIVRERFLPIEINRKSFTIYKDDDMLFQLEFEYKYRFVNPVFGTKKIDAFTPGSSEAVDDSAYDTGSDPPD